MLTVLNLSSLFFKKFLNWYLDYMSKKVHARKRGGIIIEEIVDDDQLARDKARLERELQMRDNELAQKIQEAQDRENERAEQIRNAQDRENELAEQMRNERARHDQQARAERERLEQKLRDRDSELAMRNLNRADSLFDRLAYDRINTLVLDYIPISQRLRLASVVSDMTRRKLLQGVAESEIVRDLLEVIRELDTAKVKKVQSVKKVAKTTRAKKPSQKKKSSKKKPAKKPSAKKKPSKK